MANAAFIVYLRMAIELRSDTFTKPTPAMLNAMMAAPVGDDVFGEDPTVNNLESDLAGLFNMEAAIFCPSGTMSNQIAIKAHTQPGDEVICDELSHVYQYEGGGIAVNAGCSVHLLKGNRGRITADQVAAAINPDDVHKAISRLVVLENTSNRGGGSCYQIADIEHIAQVCQMHGLALHLDGARLFNALVAKNESPKRYGKIFDSISICLSKGLGAPVGSVLVGNAALIKKARRIRKVFGGGMRQAGFLAAAGMYALQHHVERLATDHLHAKEVAEKLLQCHWVKDVMPTETNIVIFETVPELAAADAVKWLAYHNVDCLAFGRQHIRMVFHLDVHAEQVDQLIALLPNLEIDSVQKFQPTQIHVTNY